MLAGDLRYEIARSHIGDASRLDAEHVRAIFRDMEAEGRARLAAAVHNGPVRVQRSADMRYGEQIFEVNVPLDALAFERADLMDQMARAFHARHEELYTYALPDQEAVLVNARVAVIGELPELPQEPSLAKRPPAAARNHRRIYLGGWRDVPVHTLDDVAPEQVIEGPAVVESATTTVLLWNGDRASVTALGWLDIAIQA
jgi:N-methylhydantoinase A